MTYNNSNSPSVTEILLDIRSGKAGRDRVLIQLYQDKKLRAGIASVIRNVGGSKENFDDIFTTTLIQFVKTVIKRPDMVIRNELNTYLISIAKYICLANRKKQSKMTVSSELSKVMEWEDSPESLVVKKEKIHLLHELISSLGDKCKEVLMYWANGYKMKEIAKLMDYKSENMAKKKKYKCFKSLLLIMEENPQIKSALR